MQYLPNNFRTLNRHCCNY